MIEDDNSGITSTNLQRFNGDFRLIKITKRELITFNLATKRFTNETRCRFAGCGDKICRR